MTDRWTLHQGDCLDVLKTLPDNSVDAVVTDPPYGLEFMGKEWDSFRGEAWRSGAGMTKPGIGERKTEWPSFGGGVSANATCETCGGRMRGAKRCECDEPEWRVKGKPLEDRNARAESMRAFGTWCESWAREALRVVKPGGHIAAFGGTRTYHRLTVALEDAGWEIRDTVGAWMYGSGFPKSLDVSKAIDKAAGAERETVGYDASRARPNRQYASGAIGNIGGLEKISDRSDNGATITAPATEAAKQWDGWGTALKPSWEPIVLARKPMNGTVAANVLAHGTGALNIDGCRVGNGEGIPSVSATRRKDYPQSYDSEGPGWGRTRGGHAGDRVEWKPSGGRWPPNTVLCHTPDCRQAGTRTVKSQQAILRNETVEIGYGGSMTRKPQQLGHAGPDGTETIPAWDCVDGCPVKALDEQSGELHSQDPRTRNSTSPRSGVIGFADSGSHYSDTGGASRFFPQFVYGEGDNPFLYMAKASTSERNEGLTTVNNHPTVKPISLMRWLCRLVTPPSGTVLDPFNGSGTTGCAAVMEGFHYIGIEREPEYVEIARARIAHHELVAQGGVKNPWSAPVSEKSPVETPTVTLDDLFGF